MAKGSVILTHLINGDPQGIRRVTMRNKTCEMYIIPRSAFSEAKTCDAIDLKQPALYILLENIYSFADDKPKAYIGQAEDVGQRIDQHIGGKNDFFQTALVFVSSDHSINKADVQYLEFEAIKDAKAAGRFDMSSNSQNGTLPHLTPDQLDVIEEFREYVWLLTSFAGCEIFIPSLTNIGRIHTSVVEKRNEPKSFKDILRELVEICRYDEKTQKIFTKWIAINEIKFPCKNSKERNDFVFSVKVRLPLMRKVNGALTFFKMVKCEEQSDEVLTAYTFEQRDMSKIVDPLKLIIDYMLYDLKDHQSAMRIRSIAKLLDVNNLSKIIYYNKRTNQVLVKVDNYS